MRVRGYLNPIHMWSRVGGLVLCEAGVAANARNGSIDARIKIAVDIKSRRHQRSGKPPHGIADELLIALAVRFEPICIVVKSDFKQENGKFPTENPLNISLLFIFVWLPDAY